MAFRGPCQCWCVSFLLDAIRLSCSPSLPDVDFDPAKKARDERKARVAKNERQHQQNLSRAQGGSSSAAAAAPPQAQRKKEIDRTLATTRASTASMGRFDKKLEGEKKLKGVKRKVRVHRHIHLGRELIALK